MASMGHNELTHCDLITSNGIRDFHPQWFKYLLGAIIINEVLWHSLEENITAKTQDTNQ